MPNVMLINGSGAASAALSLKPRGRTDTTHSSSVNPIASNVNASNVNASNVNASAVSVGNSGHLANPTSTVSSNSPTHIQHKPETLNSSEASNSQTSRSSNALVPTAPSFSRLHSDVKHADGAAPVTSFSLQTGASSVKGLRASQIAMPVRHVATSVPSSITGGVALRGSDVTGSDFGQPFSFSGSLRPSTRSPEIVQQAVYPRAGTNSAARQSIGVIMGQSGINASQNDNHGQASIQENISVKPEIVIPLFEHNEASRGEDSAVSQQSDNAENRSQIDAKAILANIFAKNDESDSAKEQDSEAKDRATQQEAQRAEQEKQQAQADLQVIKELKLRDAEVKAHEQAHAAVGGQYAQTPRFSFEQGPDGRRYASDGEVQIDIAAVSGDPLATMNKMKQVYAAAMAPVNPSMADIQVAAEAVKKLNEAKALLAKERQEAAIDIEDIQPLIEADAAIKGYPKLPEPEFSVSGNVDENGDISRPQDSVSQPVADIVERINKTIIPSVPVSLRSTISTPSSTVSTDNQTLRVASTSLLSNKPAEHSSAGLTQTIGNNDENWLSRHYGAYSQQNLETHQQLNTSALVASHSGTNLSGSRFAISV